ncbi:MAG: electron transfer flavoprotein subunit beta/FixA family protein [Candidatus Promineifilaceae bacterium]
MRDLRVVVCMKVTPKPEEVGIDYSTNLLDRANARSEINPPDMNALELALTLKDTHGGRVDILSMGPPFFEPFLRVGLAMGADRIFLLSDPNFGGADTLATTYTLAKGIEHIGDVDLVLCGEESSDGATGQVPPGLAEWLNWNQITLVDRIVLDKDKQLINGRREVPGGVEVLQTSLPAVVSVKTASNEPRFMNYRMKDGAFSEDLVTIWDENDIDVEKTHIGLTGSPTRVSGLAQAPSRERRQEYLTGTTEQITQNLVALLDELVR